MTYTHEEYEAYLKVQREFLKEDARNFVREELANYRGMDADEIDNSELNAFDFEELVDRYFEYEDCNVAFNDTWERIAGYAVDDYIAESEGR